MNTKIDRIIDELMQLKKELAENGKTANSCCASERTDLLHVKLFGAYWKDAEVNGIREESDKSGSGMPGDRGGTIDWDIDPKTGQIVGWPKGVTARTWYKICDGFSYDYGLFHYGPNYVPDFMSLDDSGYGDYVYLSIGPEGFIRGWTEEAFEKEHTQLVQEDKEKYGNRIER